MQIKQNVIQVLLLFINILLVHVYEYRVELDGNDFIHLHDFFICSTHILIDTCFFLLLFKILFGKWNKGFTVAFFFTLIWSYINKTYILFFGCYLPLPSIFETGNLLDPIVIKSILPSFFDSYNLLYLGNIVLFICISILNKRNWTRTSYRKSIINTSILFISSHVFFYVVMCLFCVISPEYRYIPVIKKMISRDSLGQRINNAQIFRWGFLYGYSYYVPYLFESTIELSQEQCERIEQDIFIHKQNKKPVQKNLIIILVESYLSCVSDISENNIEITPFLNSLKNENGCYYNGQVKSNITIGESSDGQFILLTGLLPLQDQITISKHGLKHSFISIPKLLDNYTSEMIIPTKKGMWNQSNMCIKYEINNLYDSSIKQKETLNDEEVFDIAIDKSSNLKSGKHFSIILTLNMHSPYSSPLKEADSTISLPDDYSSEYKNYLLACNYTDKQIEKYISFLKNNGLYDSSIIVITADHQAHHDLLKMPIDKIQNENIPLFILNADIQKDSVYHGEINQVDIFPSIIDAMGINCDYQGIGHSIFNLPYRNHVNEESYQISELIIKGDYIGKYYNKNNKK